MSTKNGPHRALVENVYAVDPAVEDIRGEHLSREATIHALALLCYLMAAMLLVGTVFALATGAGLEVRSGYWGVIDVTVYVVGAMITVVVGYGLNRLRRWGRVAAIVFCSVGLLRIPVGTLIFPYFLYVLLSAKGKRVFAPDYAAIVAATPHLQYPRSIVVWTVLAVAVVAGAARYAVRLAVGG